MAHRLILRGATWYVRYSVPKDRWRDVGRATKAANGERREVVRTLQTRDIREAERRRDDAVSAIVSDLNRKLERAHLAPLTDWKADWMQRAENRKATLQAARDFLTRDELMERGEDQDTPHEMVMDDIREDCFALVASDGIETANRFYELATGNASTLGEVAQAWLASLQRDRAPVKRVAGHKTSLALLERFLRDEHRFPSRDAVPFSFITPRIAVGFVEWRGAMRSTKRKGKTVSAAAIRRELSTMTGLWRYARKLEHTALDPWREVAPKLPSAGHGEDDDDDDSKRAYTVPELLALFRAPLNEWAPGGSPYGLALRDAAALSLLTGCRIGELGRLRMRDVAADASSFVIKKGKTRSSVRTVPLSPTAQLIMRARLAHLPASPPPTASIWPEVPSDTKGKLMSSRYPAIRKRIVKAAGLEVSEHGTDFHSFRRSWTTFARDAMNEGSAVTDALLSSLMGHREATLARAVYGPGALTRHLRAAADDVERVGFPPELLAVLRRGLEST